MHKKTGIIVGAFIVFAVALSLSAFMIRIMEHKNIPPQAEETIVQDTISQQTQYKKIDVNTGAVKFSFEIPHTWLSETRHAGGKELTLEEKRQFLIDIRGGGSDDFISSGDEKRIDFMYNTRGFTDIYPNASVSSGKKIMYSLDQHPGRVDFYVIKDADAYSREYPSSLRDIKQKRNGVNKETEQFFTVPIEKNWTVETIGGMKADVLTRNNGEPGVYLPRYYYIRVNQGKDMLIIEKNYEDTEQFKLGFSHLIETLRFEQ